MAAEDSALATVAVDNGGDILGDVAAAVETPEVTTEETVETTEVKTGETTEAPEVKTGETKETEEKNADGTPLTDAQKKEKTAAAEKDASDPTPQSIRQLLKTIKDANPANAKAVKLLHNEYERAQAYSKVYPSVQEAREAKAVIDGLGGAEGISELSQTITNLQETDRKLYEGDPALWTDIIADLKAEGHPEALGKLAPGFLQSLKEHDQESYFKTMAPHFMQGLLSANLNGAIDNLSSILASVDPAKPETAVAAMAALTKGVKDMDGWFKGLAQRAEAEKVAQKSPEAIQLQKDREKLANEQKEFQTTKSKEFQTSVAIACDQDNNKLLRASLGSFLNMPFFKDGGFTRENLIPLGNQIKSDLYAALKADKTYQAQMKAMWARNPDKGRIQEYHRAKVESVSDDIVRRAVERMYPGYAKGGKAAGRIAAANTKKAETVKAETTAVATGKPIYVATKPEWNSIDWTKDPNKYLFIGGKAHLKNGKFVTWRK